MVGANTRRHCCGRRASTGSLAHRPEGLSMTAYHKFIAALKNEIGTHTSAKAAKTAKDQQSLATLASLAPTHPKTSISASVAAPKVAPPIAPARTKPEPIPPRPSIEQCLDILAGVEAELACARQLAEPEPSAAERAAWTKAAAILAEALDPARPRGDATARHWRQFCADAVRFAEQGWLHRARAAGWSMLELFGCDRAAPFARYDHMGLVLMLNGGEVAGLTDRTAVIATPTGARQIYRRVPIDQARVVLITEIGPQEPHRS